MALMNYGLEAYEYRGIYDGGNFAGRIGVTGGKEEEVSLVQEGEVGALMREDETARVVWWQEGALPAPVTAGQVVGETRVYLGDTCLAELPIKTAGSVEARTLTDCLDEIFACFFLRNPEV